MQRAIWYTGLAGGGTAIFLSLVVVGSLLFSGVGKGTGTPATDVAPAASARATRPWRRASRRPRSTPPACSSPG